MRTLFKPIFVLALAGIFLASSLLCCCVRHLAQEHSAKACCHKTDKTNPAKAGCDGCSLTLKSAENLKVFDLAPSSQANFVVSLPHTFSFKPVHVITPVFLNGPPGPVAATALYTQFCSLRI